LRRPQSLRRHKGRSSRLEIAQGGRERKENRAGEKTLVTIEKRFGNPDSRNGKEQGGRGFTRMSTDQNAVASSQWPVVSKSKVNGKRQLRIAWMTRMREPQKRQANHGYTRTTRTGTREDCRWFVTAEPCGIGRIFMCASSATAREPSAERKGDLFFRLPSDESLAFFYRPALRDCCVEQGRMIGQVSEFSQSKQKTHTS
jgi:hypothetical protein